MAVIHKIIGSLGEIGSEVLKETAKVPVDIIGKTLESGAAGKNQTQKISDSEESLSQGQARWGTLDKIQKSQSPEVRRQNARRALEQYIGSSNAPGKEPTVYEKKSAEEEEKKKILEEQKKKEEKMRLPRVSSKPRQGQLYGIHEKTTEAGKNVKAE